MVVRGFDFVDVLEDSSSVLKIVHQRGVVNLSSLKSLHDLSQPVHTRTQQFTIIFYS